MPGARQFCKQIFLTRNNRVGVKLMELKLLGGSTILIPISFTPTKVTCSHQCLPLAIDATNIGNKFTVLSINVLIRGSGIPIAWKVVKATKKGSWQPLWKELFESLKDVIPSEFTTIVCADRGLYADWLYEQIVECGWHPMLAN